MSTIRDNGLAIKDPDSVEVFQVDWDAELAEGASIFSSTWIVSPDDGVLTDDNASIVEGDRATTVRLTGGALGSKYRVTNRVTTNETPAQTKDASFYVLIQEQ